MSVTSLLISVTLFGVGLSTLNCYGSLGNGITFTVDFGSNNVVTPQNAGVIFTPQQLSNALYTWYYIFIYVYRTASQPDVTFGPLNGTYYSIIMCDPGL